MSDNDSDSDHDLFGRVGYDVIGWVKWVLRTEHLNENDEREKQELLREFAMYIMKYKNRVIL